MENVSWYVQGRRSQPNSTPLKSADYKSWSEELLLFCRWQEDRRKNFPTDSNLERKVEEAKKRVEKGEIDLDHQDKRRALRSVLQLQRKLGLAKAAGTDSMRVEGPDDGFSGN